MVEETYVSITCAVCGGANSVREGTFGTTKPLRAADVEVLDVALLCARAAPLPVGEFPEDARKCDACAKALSRALAALQDVAEGGAQESTPLKKPRVAARASAPRSDAGAQLPGARRDVLAAYVARVRGGGDDGASASALRTLKARRAAVVDERYAFALGEAVEVQPNYTRGFNLPGGRARVLARRLGDGDDEGPLYDVRFLVGRGSRNGVAEAQLSAVDDSARRRGGDELELEPTPENCRALAEANASLRAQLRAALEENASLREAHGESSAKPSKSVAVPGLWAGFGRARRRIP